MPAIYELKPTADDQFIFNLKAANHEIILTSERYTRKDSALNGIDSVKSNSPNDEQYERKVSTAGQPYFVLKATNGEIIAKSEMYSSEAARDNGIESVKTNGPAATVSDET